jgi:transcriptional regulator
MYDLPYHKEKNPEVVKEFIEKHPFAFLTGCNKDNEPVATQVPVFIEDRNGKKYLSGHIMKNTDHHKAFLHNENVLAVFSGNHSYVSATWYSNPHIASTWNYMSVHARGKIKFLDDAGLIDVLRKTSLHFENYKKESTTIYDNLSDDYKIKLLNAIVAFEVEVTNIDTVFKLSKDRDDQSYENIKQKLRERGHDGKVIAEEMEKRKPGI